MDTNQRPEKVNAKSGKFITLKEAVTFQEKHLNHRKEVLKEKEPIRSQFFGREKIEELLKKDGCVGIKIIYGLDLGSQPSLVLVASDNQLNIIAKDSSGLKGDDDNTYLGGGPTCPTECADL